MSGFTLEEWQGMEWWPNGREATTRHSGMVGHENEIVVNIEGYGFSGYIPEVIADVLAGLLPAGWKVANRSTRIEVHPSGRFNGGYTADDRVLVDDALTRMGMVVAP